MKPAGLFNSSSSVDALQTATAVIEAGAGLALLSFPSATVALLLGAPLEASAGLTVARVGGIALLTLGLACWSRAATRKAAPREDWWQRWCSIISV